MRSKLTEEKNNLVWSSTGWEDYYDALSREELLRELEDRIGIEEIESQDGVSIDELDDDELRAYLTTTYDEVDYNYEDFIDMVMPIIEEQCGDYRQTLVLFGSAANWQGSREACAVITADEFKDFVYPDYDAITEIYSDNGHLYYTQSSHDTPMGGTSMYLYSFKSEDDFEKAEELVDSDDIFGPEDWDYKDVGNIIKNNLLTPVTNKSNLGESYSQNDLINAIEWNYGCSKAEAKKKAKEMTDERKQIVVDTFKDNAKKSFLTDSLEEDYDEDDELPFRCPYPDTVSLADIVKNALTKLNKDSSLDEIKQALSDEVDKHNSNHPALPVSKSEWNDIFNETLLILSGDIDKPLINKKFVSSFYDDIKLKEDYNESLKEARYSDAYDDERKEQGWWYFTTHGVGPGTLPKDVHIIETREGQNEKGTWGDFIRLDGILNTDELKRFDLKELAPVEEEEEDFSGFFSDYDFNESFNKINENKKLTEADGGNITIETSTSILDMFYPTLYETTNDFFIAPSERGELDNILADVSMEFATEAIREVFPSATLKFEQIVHPKYYNYGGENIIFDVTLPRAEYEAVKEKAITDPNFAQFLKKNSPRDGYMPYGAYTVEKFKTQDDMYSIGQLVKFYANNDEIQYDFDDEFYTELQNHFETNEDFWEDLMGWLKEHEQAYQDFLAHFNADENDVIDVDSIIGWIYDHDTLAKDFENHFGVSLKESVKEDLNVDWENDKKAKAEVVNWWKDVEKWNAENGNKYNIDNGDYTDVEGMHAAMFDMLSELKTANNDLYKKGKTIYNKSAHVPIKEDTIKTSDGKWTNKGEEGTHGKFKTKKEADAQRKAMFANGYKESLEEDYDPEELVNEVEEFLSTHLDDNDEELAEIIFINPPFVEDGVPMVKVAYAVWTKDDEYSQRESKVPVSGRFVKKPNKPKKIEYIIVDKHGNQLSSPNPDDSELWDRVSDRDPYGRNGLKVVVYTGE